MTWLEEVRAITCKKVEYKVSNVVAEILNDRCGASNIHRYWALTAAHCVGKLRSVLVDPVSEIFPPADFGTPASLVHLWGGSTSRTTGGHLFFVSAYHLHPGYDRQSIDLDIAILEVDVSLNEFLGRFLEQ